MLRCRGVECEEAALTRSPVPEQLKLSPPPRHLPAPSPDTGPNGQHLTALQISTFYNCVTNLFLCKVSAWLEYDQTNHHVSAAQESTRPLLLSSSARPEHRCGYLYLCRPAEDAWLRQRCGCGWWREGSSWHSALHSGTAHVPSTHVHH